MIIPTDYAQANFKFAGDGVPLGAECTLGFNVELYGSDPAGLAGEIISQISANNVNDNWSDDIRLDTVEVKFGPNSTGPSAEVVAGLGGGISGECSAPNTAFLIRKLTSTGGRTGRGRMYIPGVAESQVTLGGNLVSPYAADVGATWEAFRTDMSSAGAVPVLLHGPGSPVSTPLIITSFLCDAKVATQRRRLRR